MGSAYDWYRLTNIDSWIYLQKLCHLLYCKSKNECQIATTVIQRMKFWSEMIHARCIIRVWNIADTSRNTRQFFMYIYNYHAVTWLKYCRYVVKHHSINQSIYKFIKFPQIPQTVCPIDPALITNFHQQIVLDGCVTALKPVTLPLRTGKRSLMQQDSLRLNIWNDASHGKGRHSKISASTSLTETSGAFHLRRFAGNLGNAYLRYHNAQPAMRFPLTSTLAIPVFPVKWKAPCIIRTYSHRKKHA